MSIVKRIKPDQTLTLRQKVLRPDQPLSGSSFSGDLLPEAGHFGVFDEDELISVGTVYPERCGDSHADVQMRGDGAWRLRGMATAPEVRGKGCGAQIVQACLKHAKESGAKTVWCNARTGAVPFYLRHGFKKMSGEYEMPGIGPHYLMQNDFVD
jgi:predicted GNAT family N-acyltransferase